MKNRILTSVMALVLVLTGALTAENIEHQGFSYEAGAGFSMVHYNRFTYVSSRASSLTDILRGGLSTKLGVGYFIHKHLEFSIFNYLTLYDYSDWQDVDRALFNGLLGVGMTAYFSKGSPSGFITCGYGLAYWSPFFFSGPENYYGNGLMVGLGYEFSHKYRMSLQFLEYPNSLTEGGRYFDTHSRNLSFIVSWTGF